MKEPFYRKDKITEHIKVAHNNPPADFTVFNAQLFSVEHNALDAPVISIGGAARATLWQAASLNSSNVALVLDQNIGLNERGPG